MKIDLVIIPTTEIAQDSEFKNTLLKYLFRSIAKNLPWINHIYYIIDENTLVPFWLDLSEVSLIPLKTLSEETNINSLTAADIEFLLPQLLELTSNFIVLYDSTFITSLLKPEDFFDLETQAPIYYTSLLPTKEPLEKLQGLLLNYKTLYKIDQLPQIIPRPIYGIRAYTKKLLADTLGSLKDSTTKIYSESTYYYTQLVNSTHESSKIQEGIFNYASNWAGIIKYDLENNPTRQILSITNELSYFYGTIKELHETAYQWIVEGLSTRLGNQPCKYELI